MASTVLAVVVTYRRRDVLRETLAAVQAQTTPPDRIVVVDNASDDGTDVMIRREFPAIDYLHLPENLGFAAGLAAGMRVGTRDGFDFFWLLDDDTSPHKDALQRVLEPATSESRVGVVGLRGGTLRLGVPTHFSGIRPDASSFQDCDFTLVDGALVSSGAVADVGYPRGDFFMMLEDVEFTDRIRRAGWRVGVLNQDLAERLHLGSVTTDGPPPWRGYYSARNHLVMALEHRSPAELLGWAYRQLKFLTGILLYLDRKPERLRLRLAGTLDALRRRMGRTVEPR